MIQREDFILRLIKRIAGFVARILKLKQDKQYDQALQTVGEAFIELLGSDRQWLRELDAQSIASLVGDSESILLFAQLLQQEGELYELKAEFSQAQLRLGQALELLLIAQLRDGLEVSARARLIAQLRSQADPSTVARAYRAVLSSDVPPDEGA